MPWDYYQAALQDAQRNQLLAARMQQMRTEQIRRQLLAQRAANLRNLAPWAVRPSAPAPTPAAAPAAVKRSATSSSTAAPEADQLVRAIQWTADPANAQDPRLPHMQRAIALTKARLSAMGGGAAPEDASDAPEEGDDDASADAEAEA